MLSDFYEASATYGDTVLSRTKFLGGSRHFQKEGNQLKTNLAAKIMQLQELIKFFSKIQNKDWKRVEFQ